MSLILKMFHMNGSDLSRSFVQDALSLGLSDKLNFGLIFEKSLPCVVGVSGGPDSVYLLCQLVSYFVKQGRDLGLINIVHIDYGFRKESSEVAKSVEMKSQGLSYHYFLYDGKEREGDARDFRRHCYREVSQLIGSSIILLGNHLDDRIETCLMRIMQGCGSFGLKVFSFATTMNPSSMLKVFRPLIHLQKKQILNELDLANVWYDIDHTNYNPNYTIRNKLRSLISSNSQKPFYYDAWDDFFARLEKQYTFPLSIQKLFVPKRCKRDVIRLTKCNTDELLSYCKSYIPHLGRKHFDRIIHLQSGQKIQLGQGFVTNTYGEVFHLLPRLGYQATTSQIISVGPKTLISILKDKKIPRFLRDSWLVTDGVPVSETWRLDQLNK